MRTQQQHRRNRVAAQAKAIDTASIAITAGLGLIGLLAGLASLLH